MEEENNKNIQKNVLKINFKLFIIIAVVVAIVAVIVVGLVIRNKRIEETRKIEELEAERKRVAEILKNSSNKTENETENATNIEKEDFNPNKEENKTASTVEEYIKQIYPLKSVQVMVFPEFESLQFANKEWLWSTALYNSERF